jgi:hypothetical protein
MVPKLLVGPPARHSPVVDLEIRLEIAWKIFVDIREGPRE